MCKNIENRPLFPMLLSLISSKRPWTYDIQKEEVERGVKMFSDMSDTTKRHCVKSVQIRSFVFWSVFSCIRTEYGDLRSKSGYFSRSAIDLE